MNGAPWKPEYICVLDGGCQGSQHSLNCQKKNEEYVIAARTTERRKRLEHMEAVIRGEEPPRGRPLGA